MEKPGFNTRGFLGVIDTTSPFLLMIAYWLIAFLLKDVGVFASHQRVKKRKILFTESRRGVCLTHA
jgi:hypothetical protein